MAIRFDTMVAGAARQDRLVRVRSLNLGEDAEFDLDGPGSLQRGVWLNYVEGVARALESRGVQLHGADLLIESNVPLGAGLSSSAALEIAVGLALVSLADAEIDPVSLALAGQQAEHEYVGTRSGIMDQFIATLARRGHALLIDCRTLEASHIPLDTSDVAVVICDTQVKHELASSEYNTRRAECERGVEILRQVMPDMRALRDLTVAEFERFQELLPEPIRRRCRHVVTENERTLTAAEALRNRDLKRVGKLMEHSHRSLRDDYEVSSPELDLLVDIAWTARGVLGARMTGGGFGGSTVNLVSRDCLDEFRETITREYTRAIRIEPAIYVSDAVGGAAEVR